MIRTAFFAANVAAGPLVVIDPPATDLLARSVRNVALWGGDAARYRTSLATGLRVADANRTPIDLRDLAAVAAWRCGVPQIREDALDRIRHCCTSDPGSAPIFAAALGIPTPDLPGLLRAQQTDRFGWIAPMPVTAAIGGFRGVGGRFGAPPTAVATDGVSLFVRTGTEYWRAQVDIFGATLTTCAEPVSIAWSSSCVLETSIIAEVYPSSYLIWLCAGPEAAVR